MTPEHHQHVADLFARARRLDAAGRRALLADGTVEESIRDQVERLLAEDDATTSPLDSSPGYRAAADAVYDQAVAPTPSSTNEAPIDVPEFIGPYRMLDRLGEGGMGLVFLAEQTEPLRRRVALKIIKLGMDTRAVMSRFEAERQALALMDHANVARVFDAGATDQGRPYFVMEYVDGQPITAYADQHALSTRDRLRLFIQVCEAVQHAHHKGIIHRDLKPSNVLVTTQQGRPVPKVIDFGIAKATEHKLTERTLLTEQGQFIGTPEYMSPEQAGLNPHDVDTRTDVYALGVMLYELLVGQLPFDSDSLRRASLAEIQRIIREQEPPKPSTRLSRLTRDSESSAARRGTTQASLNRQLRGDVDWIVMKAIDKDRTRRYASALDLAEDIGRHLDHQTVLAAAPTRSYRIRKFLRRHRTACLGAGVTLVVLIAGIATTGWQALSATRARNEASTQAATATAIKDFLEDMLLSADPRDGDMDVRVVDILDDAVVKLEDSFEDQPEVAESLLMTIGRVYIGLGRHAEAVPVFDKLLALRRRLYDADDPLIGGALSNLAVAHRNLGNNREAVALYEEASAILRNVPGEEERVVIVLNNLATAHEALGQHAEAETFARQSVALHRKMFGPDDVKLAMALHALSATLTAQAKFDESVAVVDETVAIMRKAVGPDHPYLAISLTGLAALHRERRDFDAGIAAYEEALGIFRQVYGDDHPYTLSSAVGLATLLGDVGRHEEGETMLTTALGSLRQAGDAGRPSLVTALDGLAAVLERKGDLDGARTALGEAIDIETALSGVESPGVVKLQKRLEDVGRRED